MLARVGSALRAEDGVAAQPSSSQEASLLSPHRRTGHATDEVWLTRSVHLSHCLRLSPLGCGVCRVLGLVRKPFHVSFQTLSSRRCAVLLQVMMALAMALLMLVAYAALRASQPVRRQPPREKVRLTFAGGALYLQHLICLRLSSHLPDEDDGTLPTLGDEVAASRRGGS